MKIFFNHSISQTPLHWAAAGGHLKCAEILLQHGADKTLKRVAKNIL